jgi:SHS2 domain-containing protein
VVDVKRFEFLEHTADAYIAAYGRNMAEAFENAALAMLEVMTDTKKIEPVVEDSFDVSAEDEYALLYSWLEALLVKFDAEEMLYSKFNILSLEHKDSDCRLKAKACGEKFDAQRHPSKVGVKAVTYHRMEVLKKPGKVTVRFILDL